MKKVAKITIELKKFEVKGESLEYYELVLPVDFMGVSVPVQLALKTKSQADKVALDFVYKTSPELDESID